MNELEIDQCLKSHPLTRDVFRGVFARDELISQMLLPNSLFIINTDKRQDPGQHWVLCYWSDQEPHPLYFDSYGEMPYYEEIEIFLLKNSDNYTYNKKQLQGTRSSVCGHYVTYISTQLCAGYSMQEIRLQHFSKTHFPLNDRMITTLFRKEFSYPRVAYKVVHTPMTCYCRCDYGSQ